MQLPGLTGTESQSEHKPVREFRSIIVGLALFVAALLASSALFHPRATYFFGDTWDLFYEAKTSSLAALWSPDNEHFMPFFKGFLRLEFVLFGMWYPAYALVNLCIHASNALLIWIVSGRMGVSRAARLLGWGLFAFSGLFWEIPMWEMSQAVSLSLFFVLLALYLTDRYLRTREWVSYLGAVGSAFLSPLAFTVGLIAGPMMLLYWLSFGPRPNRREIPRLLMLGLAPLFLYVSLYLWKLGPRIYTPGPHPKPTLSPKALGMWTWITLRDGILVPNFSVRNAGLIILAVVTLGVIVGLLRRGRGFFSHLLVPVALFIVPVLLTGMGRAGSGGAAGFGVHLAASSRYLYFPIAAWALFSAVAAQGILPAGETGTPIKRSLILVLLGLCLVLQLNFGINYVQTHSPRAEGGMEARQYVRQVIEAPHPAPPQGEAVVDPEAFLPAALYPLSFPVSRAELLYGRDEPFYACAVPIKLALFSPSVRRFNLLASPAGGPLSGWTAAGSASGSACRCGLEGQAALMVNLPQFGSAERRTVAICCSQQAFTFGALVRVAEPSTAVKLWLAFLDARGNILRAARSDSFPYGNFDRLYVSEYPPRGSLNVVAEIVNEGGKPASAIIQDPILVRHPVYLPGPEAATLLSR